MISARGIQLRFGAVDVLSGVDLATHPGQTIGLIGPNGSGKSTLLRCMYGMLQPHGGAVFVDDRAIDSLSRREIARDVAVVAQDVPVDGIGITVSEFVLLGRHAHRGDHQGFTHHDHHLALDALERVHLAPLASRGLNELSGGERQRVMVARCLAQQSPTMLLDEPTNHLDIRHQFEVLDLVRGLGLNTIIVLHDLNLANRFCDHLALLDRGRVVAHGEPDDVLRSELLEPVYGIEVKRVADDGRSHLVFGPAAPTIPRSTKGVEVT